MIGQTLSHYRITEKIGAGGMGEVYKAKDEHLSRDVVIKVLPSGTLADEQARKRFHKEALALSKLNHPNIATVHDFDTQEDVDFIVMELVEGATLAEKVKTGPLAEKEISDLGAQIADALEEAHERGIVHRDLKPGNIAVTPKARVKVLDFGLARILRPVSEEATTEALTQEHAVAGTLPYMSPEELRGEKADHRSDLFSFGVVLYEMATGRRPFEHTISTALADAIIHKTPDPPGTHNRKVSAGLESIIFKTLDKDPEHRYQSAREMRVDLERLITPVSGVVPKRKSALVRRWLWAAGCVVAVIASVFLLNVGGLRDRLVGAPAPRIDSIAVLPLENLSGDPEQEYFADGMTEALITDLAKIGALKVISRTSAMRYKGTSKSLPEIARELDVDGIVEGSVLRAEDRVRITAQLIEAETDRHIWAESYERELRDVLRLQREVARSIAREINLQLTPQEESALAGAHAIDPQAHQAYLKGRYHWNKRDAEGLRSSITFFEEAIDREPEYALAYAGLADAYNMLGRYNFLPPEVAFPKGLEMAEMALRLDKHCAEAYAARAFVEKLYEWDWGAAEASYSRALALNPGYAIARHFYSGLLEIIGRFDESLAEEKRALQLDPLSLIINLTLGRRLYVARHYDEAILQYQATLDLDPDFMPGLIGLGNVYLQVARYDEAISLFQRALELSGDPGWGFDPALGHAYAKAGRRDDALRLLRKKEELSRQRYVSPVHFAFIYAALDERDKAFEYLESAFEKRSGELIALKVNPVWDPLRSDPRFQDLLRRMNFPE